MIKYMLTTVDNPYDPMTQFNDWYVFDTRYGYNTLSLLARIAKVSDDLADPVYEEEINKAIDEIVKENVSGMHKKIEVMDRAESSPLP
jgi:hypothetical protein